MKAVQNFPEPTCTKDAQRLIGLTSFFRKFIYNYSIIVKPLSDLLRKNTDFSFGSDARKAFQELKFILCSEPVLTLYNPHSETEVHIDASIHGYGAILMQRSVHDNKFHSVYYMSRKTSETESKYTSFQLEVLAVIEALKHFRVYLLGIPFKLITDCNAFEQTMSQKDVCNKIARWALMLEEFNYTIDHRPHSRMRHVDALSRHPVCMLIQDSIVMKVQKAQETDEHLCTIKELLKAAPHDNYVMKNNVLYKTVNGIDLLVIPELMQPSIIKTAHERGHYAVT
ncbi:Transposon Tf2-9 polyprotein [Araneus ventricosus]|uniref:RNA-directed DNA polymerase n=1 Tax=Araneus ventricosus TaxID=182803 RepID=A0A4Y2AK92_ARAVE|nr:Transposon Tf2-9 polyprotein [Araneus ventricosus]